MRSTTVTSITAFVLALTPSAMAQGAGKPPAGLGCVPVSKLSCGCYVRIRDLSCTALAASPAPHFFSGLGLTDPLLLQFEGQDYALLHTQHIGTAVKGDIPGRWADEYAAEKFRIRISYAPATSTCPKSKGEPCEYTDYSAEVVVQRAGTAPLVLKANATCGC